MRIHIKNNSVYPQKIFAVGRGSYGFDTLEFVFSRDWRGLTKTIVFVSPDGAQTRIKYKDSAVSIPREILLSRGKCLVFAIGENAERSKSSVQIELWIAGDIPEQESEV